MPLLLSNLYDTKMLAMGSVVYNAPFHLGNLATRSGLRKNLGTTQCSEYEEYRNDTKSYRLHTRHTAAAAAWSHDVVD